jgi:Spy/CpxP family protein refolding chaperone
MQSRPGVRAQMMNVLTPDQKAKLEEMMKTRRANHEKLKCVNSKRRQRVISAALLL